MGKTHENTLFIDHIPHLSRETLGKFTQGVSWFINHLPMWFPLGLSTSMVKRLPHGILSTQRDLDVRFPKL
jgi:hypothetical protein